MKGVIDSGSFHLRICNAAFVDGLYRDLEMILRAWTILENVFEGYEFALSGSLSSGAGDNAEDVEAFVNLTAARPFKCPS